MHILITGAGGFIGRSVVRKAHERGWNVTAIARRACAEATVVADLRQPLPNLDRPDAVIHLAGNYVGGGRREFAEGDLRISSNLIEWGRKKGVKRWVFASAAEVYGNIEGEATEEYPCSPVIPYGGAKLETEELFRSASLPETIVLRIGEVYGAGGRLISELSERLKDGFCPWAGDGKVKISFVHVDDVAEALLLACEHAKPGINIYNTGDESPATWKEFIEEIARLLGTRGPLYLPRPVAMCYAASVEWAARIAGRSAAISPNVLRLLTTPKVLSSRRIREELGFIPKFPDFRTGLRNALVDSANPN